MMTREEAKEILENWNLCHYTPSREAAEMVISALDPLEIISALRPVSREQVEKVWRGNWKKDSSVQVLAPGGQKYHFRCSKCGYITRLHDLNFCSECGTPMTDEAVEMVMERMEALHHE